MPPKLRLPKKKVTTDVKLGPSETEDDGFKDSFPEIFDLEMDDDIEIVAAVEGKSPISSINNPQVTTEASGPTQRSTQKSIPKVSKPAVRKGLGLSRGKNLNVKKLEALAKINFKEPNDKQISTADEQLVCLPWVDRNLPNSLDELFVHKKKVQDVHIWMKHALAAYDSGKPPILCLLTGPSGSGKTATTILIAKDVGAEVKEWVNPMTLTQFSEGRYDSEEVQGRSQIELFSDFLTRSSQYSSLPMKNRKASCHRLIVVEDFPNTFYREPQTFHSILRSYCASGAAPIVFIVPDNAAGECNPLRLFPKTFIQELKIVQFSFNAVAPSLMMKFLSVICSRENVSVNPAVLESVVATSSGDIRCAINTLQFKVLQEKPSKSSFGFKRPLPKIPKLKKDKMLQTSDLMQKDESLFLFRALGKVLYNKRDRSIESELEKELSENLSKERRPFAALENPEDIYSKIEVLTDTFLGFLHQNYLSFFSTIEDCVAASNYMASADELVSRWNSQDSSLASRSFKTQDTREKMALSIALRGLMHANQARVSSEWRPLRKPLCGDIHTKTSQNFAQAKYLFPPTQPVVESFYTETLPFMAKSLRRGLSADQQKFAMEVGLYKDSKQFKKAKWGETLDEKALVEEESEATMDVDNPETSSLGSADSVEMNAGNEATVEIRNAEDNNDFIIEEYED